MPQPAVEYPTDEHPTDDLAALLHLDRAELQPDLASRTALSCDGDDVSYGELYTSARAAAGALASSGIASGDVVALWLTNRPELVELYLGCFLLGAVAMPLFPPMNEHEVRELLDHAGPSLLVTEAAVLAKCEPGASERLGVPMTWSVGGAVPGAIEYRQALASAPPWSDAPAASKPDAPATLTYTSGTTGMPKGAVHLHHHHAAGIRNQRALVGHTPDDRVLVFLSIAHTFGMLGALLPALSAGATVVLMDGFDPGAAADALIAERITLMYGLPTMYTLILEQLDRFPNRHPDTLRNAMIAGDSAPMDLHRRFALRMGLVLQEGYALTETMMVAANPTDRAKVVGSLGSPLPGMSVRLRTEAGVTDEPGISGEIEVRGDTVLSHYYRNEEATRAALVDGWLRTGDLGSLDADGRLWFQGRVKSIIVVGGENIAPAEVAAAFCRHPDVVEAAVVGTSDDITGQRLVAFAAVRPESSTTAAAVEEFVRGYLTGFKVPGRIELRSSLPKAATGKIDYEALESEARRTV